MQRTIKKINKYVFIITGSLLMIVVVALSCKKQGMALFPDSQKALSHDNATAESLQTENCSTCTGIWSPKNITVKKVNPHTVYILNNAEYRYIGENLQGQLVPGLSGVSLTCTCTVGSGCSPGRSGDNYACILSENCTACNGTKNGLLPGSQPGQFETAKLKSGGFIKKRIEVHFATKSELLEQAYIFPAMSKLSEVKKAVKEFETKYIGDTVRVLVSVAGRIAILQVDKKIAELNGAVVLAAKGTCSCTDGSCEYVKIPGLGEGCNAANCKASCTLTTGVKIDGKTLEYQSFQF